MQENWLQLAHCFSTDQEFVLATIINTQGSTYRKTGTMMLVTRTGECIGLLSGGCLEADISLHAQQVFDSLKPCTLSYDLKADAELLWGLGLGCDGAIDILLQPLTKDNNHLAFGAIIETVLSGKSGVYCQQLDADLNASAEFYEGNTEDATFISDIERSISASGHEFLLTPVSPVINILVCGAGPDVVPVIEMAAQLGWRVTLQDHRQAHLEQSSFNSCFDKRKLRAENCVKEDFLGFDGVVIMTHNLTADGFLLEHALSANIGYIGVLGPSGRRDKLLKQLSLTASDVQNQVFGPIGLDIGGRSPHAIALSICAQIQQYISLKFQQRHLKSWRL